MDGATGGVLGLGGDKTHRGGGGVQKYKDTMGSISLSSLCQY